MISLFDLRGCFFDMVALSRNVRSLLGYGQLFIVQRLLIVRRLRLIIKCLRYMVMVSLTLSIRTVVHIIVTVFQCLNLLNILVLVLRRQDPLALERKRRPSLAHFRGSHFYRVNLWVYAYFLSCQVAGSLVERHHYVWDLGGVLAVVYTLTSLEAFAVVSAHLALAAFQCGLSDLSEFVWHFHALQMWISWLVVREMTQQVAWLICLYDLKFLGTTIDYPIEIDHVLEFVELFHIHRIRRVQLSLQMLRRLYHRQANRLVRFFRFYWAKHIMVTVLDLIIVVFGRRRFQVDPLYSWVKIISFYILLMKLLGLFTLLTCYIFMS